MMTKLEQAARQIIVDWDSGIHLYEAITALREALAEQSYDEAHGISSYHLQETEQVEQEPVAIVEDWPTDSTPKGIVALGDIKEFPAGTLLYASPAISTEVFTREKVDSLLIAAYTKGRNDLLEKQAEQEPVAWGCRFQDGSLHDCICPESHAECEGDYNIPLYDAPVSIALQSETDSSSSSMRTTVRTKDLTDDEIDAFIDRAWDKQMSMPEIIRAVIQEFRRKNDLI